MQLKIWAAETCQCAATPLGHTAGIVVLMAMVTTKAVFWLGSL